MSAPQIEWLTSATITRHHYDPNQGSCAGAVYDSSGRLVPSSLRDIDREEGFHSLDPEMTGIGDRVIGPGHDDGADLGLSSAVFGGHAFGAWGHSITEGLGSLWIEPESLRFEPIIFMPWGRVWQSAFDRFTELTRLAGFDRNPVILSSGRAHVDRLAVPERLIGLDRIVHRGEAIPEHMNVVYDRVMRNAVSAVPLNLRGPIYLSRGQGHRREEPFELELENHFRRQGFLVVRGWELSVAEQVARVAASSIIVGMSGSALHNAVFAPMATPVVEILDSREAAFRMRRHSVQGALCELRAHPYRPVDPMSMSSTAEIMELVDDAVSSIIS